MRLIDISHNKTEYKLPYANAKFFTTLRFMSDKKPKRNMNSVSREDTLSYNRFLYHNKKFHINLINSNNKFGNFNIDNVDTDWFAYLGDSFDVYQYGHFDLQTLVGYCIFDYDTILISRRL